MVNQSSRSLRSSTPRLTAATKCANSCTWYVGLVTKELTKKRHGYLPWNLATQQSSWKITMSITQTNLDHLHPCKLLSPPFLLSVSLFFSPVSFTLNITHCLFQSNFPYKQNKAILITFFIYKSPDWTGSCARRGVVQQQLVTSLLHFLFEAFYLLVNLLQIHLLMTLWVRPRLVVWAVEPVALLEEHLKGVTHLVIGSRHRALCLPHPVHLSGQLPHDSTS